MLTPVVMCDTLNQETTMKKTEFLTLKIGPELLEKIGAQMKVDKRQSRGDQVRVLLEEAIEARELVKESERVGASA